MRVVPFTVCGGPGGQLQYVLHLATAVEDCSHLTFKVQRHAIQLHGPGFKHSWRWGLPQASTEAKSHTAVKPSQGLSAAETCRVHLLRHLGGVASRIP
jgi:hypothetical protein